MWIGRDKEGKLICMSPRRSEAYELAEAKVGKDNFIVEEALDQAELFEIYRSYYGTRSL